MQYFHFILDYKKVPLSKAKINKKALSVAERQSKRFKKRLHTIRLNSKTPLDKITRFHFTAVYYDK